MEGLIVHVSPPKKANLVHGSLDDNKKLRMKIYSP